MTPLLPASGGTDLVAWRLDLLPFTASWDSGEGAFLAGGRWNSRGVRAVCCAIDPSTAILEVAVHKGFRVPDTVPHVLTAMTVAEPAGVHVLRPEAVPNPHWLHPGIASAGQQAFGNALLAQHGFALVPSVISTHRWNLVFLAAAAAAGRYARRSQERFALDLRLHPPG